MTERRKRVAKAKIIEINGKPSSEIKNPEDIPAKDKTSVKIDFDSHLDFILYGLSRVEEVAKVKNETELLVYTERMRDFLSTRITELKIIPNPDGNFPYRYEVNFIALEGETTQEVEAQIKEYLNSPVFNGILVSADPVLMEILRQKEELRKNRREIEKLKKELKSTKKPHTKIAIHTVTQFYGDSKQLNIFSDAKIDAFSKATGLSITNRPDSYGVVLNQSQRRVLEGILKAFSDTNYSGDEELEKKIALKNVYTESKTSIETLVTGEGAPYGNIDKIPMVRLTQAQIIQLSGYERTQGDKEDVIQAIEFLATKQFCFYWVRAKTENGKIAKDKKGDYVKEDVMEVGSLFRIKTVRNEAGELQYYEIHPSAPLLDQVNNYFLLVPKDWREEVKELTGKRASNYTYELLFWLRLQYEQIRRFNDSKVKNRKKKDFTLRKNWEEVAIALKMPESMYKLNRKRARNIIQDAYSTAIKLGYLVRTEDNGATDTLFLNESYYPKPGKLI